MIKERFWTIALDAVPEEREVVVVEQDGGGGSTALFLRARPDTPSKGTVPLSDGTYALAYLNVCTHMGCRLVRGKGERLDNDEAIIGPCPCHGTRFDLLKAGLVVLGPATQNLPQLTIVQTSSGLRATLAETDQDPLCESWPGK